VKEKLKLMEAIWENLAQTPEQVPTPDWHQEELDRRRARADADPSVFKSWEEVKR
jgi:putative addiction module component (TIGR02574 family)